MSKRQTPLPIYGLGLWLLTLAPPAFRYLARGHYFHGCWSE
ncbi:MAG: hypothetical protein RID09_16030 [Coleofasciculus sp. G1-WW12-02]